MDHPFRGHGPLFLLLASFLAGVFLGLCAGPAWAGAAGVALLFSVLAMFLRLSSTAVSLAIMLLCGTLAAGRLPLADPAQVAPFLDNEVVLRAHVAEVRPRDSGWSAVGSDATIATTDGSRRIPLDRVLVSVRSPDAPASLPSEIRAAGRLHPMRDLGNPGRIPREWNAMAMRVQYVFSTDASRVVLLPPEAAREGVSSVFARARERASRWLDRHAGRSDGALYLKSLTTGEVPPSSHPMVTLLRKTGLGHLLAISGINVSIFFILHAFLVRGAVWVFRMRHGWPDLNRVSTLVSIPACWAYVLMAGAPVPAVRSAGMITLGVLLWNASGTRRADTAWTVLCLLTVLVSPFVIVSPSFLLSFGAAFFLIVSFTGRAREGPPLPASRRALRWGRDALVASTVAFLGTLPVSAAFFGSFPAGSILWNLLFGPVLGTAGVAGAFLAAVGGAFSLDILGAPVRLIAQGLSGALALLGRLSGDGWGCFPLPPSGVAPPLCCVGAAVWGSLLLRRRGKEAWPAPFAAAFVFLGWIHLPYAALPDDRLTLTALNVGKGAAHVVSFPGGGHMVIDCGSAAHGDSGGRIVGPHLRSLGVRRIDVLVLTHPHEDHTGGAGALLDDFPVGEIWVPDDVPVEAFGEAVARKASIVKRKRRGESYRAGGAEVRIHGAGAAGPLARANERSLLLEVRHGPLSVWLPGDADKGSAAWGAPGRDAGKTRVLFLPHHGSPGADPASWVSACRPSVVVSQNRNCFANGNLLPSFEYFLLENGAFTVRSNGKTVTCEQEGRPKFWKLIWRLA